MEGGDWFKVSVRPDRRPGDWREPSTFSYNWMLQTALHTKAKNSPDCLFYAQYDMLYR